MTVHLTRSATLTKSQILAGADEDDRKLVGYSGFYQDILDLIADMKMNHSFTYAKYWEMTQSWITEAR